MIGTLLVERCDACAAAAPRLFRIEQPDDRAELERLFRDEPRLVVHDRFLAQLAELVEVRAPRTTLTHQETDRAVADWLGGRAPEAAGVWAHYPWSHRLVHVLDEDEFVELRTVRNLYKITREEQAVLATKRVGVVGLSVGQSVSLTLAMERGAGELRIADMDNLGLSNLNRIRYGVHGLGLSKTTMVAREIAEIDPYLRVRTFDDGLTEANVDAFFLEGGRLDAVVDECDDMAIKVLIRVRARALGIPVVMDTSDRGLLDVERFDLEPTRPIFHGLTGELDPASLRGLTAEEKLPHLFALVATTTSPRMIASLVEVGVSIKTWPQLASSVVLGGAVTADTIRRIFLGQIATSGRYLVDLEALVCPGMDAGMHAETHAGMPEGGSDDGERARPAAPDADGSDVAAIVAAGCAAPSGGNHQPWHWLARGQRVWLCRDRARGAPVLDFGGTASYLALGAALENAVLAAHARGIPVRVAPFPTDAPSGWDAVALLELGPTSGSAEPHTHDALAAFIDARCTNRQLGRRVPLGAVAADALRMAAESVPGVRLVLVESDAALAEIAGVLGAGERIRFLNKAFHAELMAEARWSREEAERTRDGIDIDTLELGAKERAGFQLCRSWAAMQAVARIGGGEALERGPRRAIDAASAVGLLVADGVTPQHFLDGGRALQRLWLTATQHGVALQPQSALPYLFARLLRGGGEGLTASQCQELRTLRAAYERVLPVTPEDGELLLFRLADAPPPSVRALRRGGADVLTYL